MRTERCKNGNIHVHFDGDYEDALDRLEASEVQIQTRTPHMSIASLDGEQFIIKSDRIVVPGDDEAAAERLAEDVLGDMVAE